MIRHATTAHVFSLPSFPIHFDFFRYLSALSNPMFNQLQTSITFSSDLFYENCMKNIWKCFIIHETLIGTRFVKTIKMISLHRSARFAPFLNYFYWSLYEWLFSICPVFKLKWVLSIYSDLIWAKIVSRALILFKMKCISFPNDIHSK